jgi:hypothetical protein
MNGLVHLHRTAGMPMHGAVPRADPPSGHQSLSELLVRAVGQQCGRLHPDILHRFTSPTLAFSGRMQSIYCSLPGWCVARLLAPAQLLPSRCAHDVGFTFRVAPAAGGLCKERVYQWQDDDQPFVFRSLLSEEPRLHERFAFGLGMNLRVRAVDDGALLITNDGYFLQLGLWCMPLPRALLGRFVLLHTNVDARRFRVQIRILNAIWGTLFYQSGEFVGQEDAEPSGNRRLPRRYRKRRTKAVPHRTSPR